MKIQRYFIELRTEKLLDLKREQETGNMSPAGFTPPLILTSLNLLAFLFLCFSRPHGVLYVCACQGGVHTDLINCSHEEKNHIDQYVYCTNKSIM